jgi:hypothetical protein
MRVLNRFLAPPLTLAETDDGPLRGPFSFLFQRGLAVATALRRLAKYPKSVSEPALSLTDRPWPSEGRIRKVYYFQCFGVFEGAPFSKSQAVSKHDANRGTGLRAVVLGGKRSFAAVFIEVCYVDETAIQLFCSKVCIQRIAYAATNCNGG